ncbi:hypothetical protein [Rhodanobacter sp. MP7CTX1]|jgi:hypothetical protein|nr:hypothetical protein [Rhodanobacter sp. MP7CTX1]MBB6189388.1 hypothetical protein [Rhodanobacter sp. MP7CTX1]
MQVFFLYRQRRDEVSDVLNGIIHQTPIDELTEGRALMSERQ